MNIMSKKSRFSFENRLYKFIFIYEQGEAICFKGRLLRYSQMFYSSITDSANKVSLFSATSTNPPEIL
jgi:hypothetical protein